MSSHSEPARDGASAGSPDYLVLDRVTKRYGERAVVDRVSFGVARGEVLTVLGPSGCGKTTTLKIIAGFLDPGDGSVSMDGAQVDRLSSHQRGAAMVFQNYALFPHMTIARNVAFGLEMRRLPKDKVATLVKGALDLVQLGHLAERRPRELSGGQQQRVALARALVIEPSILLLDEPLSNLDAKLRDQMRVEIRDIQQRLGITTVFVTHDQVEALSMCDRIAVMEKGQLAQVGTPDEIYERPATPFVAEFVGRINKLPGRLGPDGQVEVGAHRFRVARPEAESGEVTVMVRPHRVRIERNASAAAGANAATGTVTRSTYVGDIVEYRVDIGGAALQVERATGGGRETFAAGDPVHLAWSPDDTLVFAGSR